MTDYTIPAVDSGLGIPSKSSDTIGAGLAPLFLSSHPAPLSQAFDVAASQTRVAGTVVGLDANGRIVKAVYNATPASRTNIIGVLADAITTDASTNYKGAIVYTAGHFNDARLTWDASFVSQATKDVMLETLGVLGRIVVGTVKTYTP